MTTNVDNLVELLTAMGDTSEDDAIMRRIITRLDAIEDGSSVAAAKAINEGTLTVLHALKMWVMADHRIDTAVRVASSISNATKRLYSAARYILDDAIISGALDAYYTVHGGVHAVSEVRAAHQLMLTSAPHLIPDMNTATKRDVVGYCVPLATAASLLHLKLNNHLAVPTHLFNDKAIPFVVWASEHNDLDLVIATAHRIGSLDPEAITEFNAALKSTHGALDTGVL
jgi:hypothetical protein